MRRFTLAMNLALMTALLLPATGCFFRASYHQSRRPNGHDHRNDPNH